MHTSVPFTLSIFLSISVSSIDASRHVRQFKERTHVKCSSSYADKQGRRLLEACREGDVARAKELLRHGASVNYQGNSVLCEQHLLFEEEKSPKSKPASEQIMTDETPLGLAAYYGHVDLVSMLLDAGAQVDTPCWFGVPLVAAIRNPQEQKETVRPVVELLLSRGASVHCVNGFEKGHVLKHTNRTPPGCETPLTIDTGKPWSGKVNNYWTTPLIEAAARGYESIVTMLLNCKANIDHHNAGYDMATRAAMFQEFWNASSQGQLAGAACRKTLTDAKVTFGTALDNAIRGGHAAIVAKLIHAGANVNPGVNTNQANIPDIAAYWPTGPPLAMAVRTGNQTIVQMLLDNGACVDKDRGPCGGTALWEAAKHNHVHLIRLLITVGANVNCCPYEGPAWTAAIRSRHEAALKALIDGGIDLDLPAGEKASCVGISPVMLAAAVDWKRGVELLFARGACRPTQEQCTILEKYCKRRGGYSQSPQWSFGNAMALLQYCAEQRVERVVGALETNWPRDLALLIQKFEF